MSSQNVSLEFLSGLDSRQYAEYAISEAAFYIGMHPSRLLAWVKGSHGKTGFKPVIDLPEGTQGLSFYALASAHVLLAFRRYRISLQSIRRSMAELMKYYGDEPYPLLNRDFRTDRNNRHLFIKTATETSDLSDYSQLMLQGIVDERLDRIEFDEQDLARAFYPLREIWEHAPGHKRVIIDSLMAGGKPSIVGTGIPVEAVYTRFRHGESADDLANDYGLDLEDVKEAIQYYEAA